MRVLIFSASDKIWEGSHIYIESLCSFLNSAGIPTWLMSANPSLFKCQTLPAPFAMKSRLSRLITSLTVAIQLRRNKIDTVILNDLSSLWLAPIFRLAAVRVVGLAHLELRLRTRDGFGHPLVEYFLIRASSYFAHEILTVNEVNLHRFSERTRFVGNFVPDWFFEDRSPIDRRYDIGMVSRLANEKNLPLFLDIVRHMREILGSSVQALIVGDGPERDWLENEIESLGLTDCIELQGWTDRKKLPLVYSSLKCLAVTSHYEGFPTTALEAHARGVPVVASQNAGYLPRFLSDGISTTGVIISSEDSISEHTVRKIIELSRCGDNLREECREKARGFGEEKILGTIRDIILETDSAFS